MDEDLAAPDVLCNCGHNGIELGARKLTIIFNWNMNVRDFVPSVAWWAFGQRNDSSDAERVCFPEALPVKQTSQVEPLPNLGDMYQAAVRLPAIQSTSKF